MHLPDDRRHPGQRTGVRRSVRSGAGVHAVEGGIIFYGVLPELVGVDWEIEGTNTSGGLMIAADGEPEAGLPFALAIPATVTPKGHGQLIVRFRGADDTVAYPVWRSDLPN